jgi:hypothetical protein
MKRITLVLALSLCSVAQAAPFLVSDPDPTGAADLCTYKDGSAAAVDTPVVKNAAGLPFCHIDLGPAAAGMHTVTVAFKSTLWGVSSATTPFSFTKPSALTAPANMSISGS